MTLHINVYIIPLKPNDTIETRVVKWNGLSKDVAYAYTYLHS